STFSSDQDSFRWDWKVDFNSGLFPGISLVQKDNKAILPAMFVSEGGIPPATYTTTPRETLHNLRSVYTYLEPGQFASKLKAPSSPAAPSFDCNTIGCNVAIHDPRQLIYPPDLWKQEFEPGILFRVNDTYLVLTDPAKSNTASLGLDISAKISDPLKDLLGNPDIRKVQAVEFGRVRLQVGDRRDAILLPKSLDRQSLPVSVVRGPQGLTVEGHRSPTGAASEVETMQTTPTSNLEVREGYHGMYVASEDSLYVVGGSNRGSNTPGAWRYALAEQRWQNLFYEVEQMPGHASVKAATYLPARKELIVLEVGEGSNGPFPVRVARLRSFNVATKTNRTLAVWPFLGLHDKHFLSVLDDEQVALTVSGKQHYTVFRFKVSGSKANLTGFFKEKGVLLSAPIPGYDRLFFPVARSGNVGLDPVGKFVGGGVCSL
ncbi:MAG: hypothetical protein RMJ98_19430, partial [Myxococcales bacterium]|nr:hypothetical protein [Myxococcales bacterium]